MTTYGYVRKNFPTSEVEQLTVLLKYGCDELFIEGHSLLETEELEKMLEKLNSNDTVVVTHLRVFGQKLQHLRPVIEYFVTMNIRLVSLEDQVDTVRDTFFYPLFDVFSKMDSECRAERLKQQIEPNSQSAVEMGRPSIDEEVVKRIYELYHEQNWTMRRIAEECGVSLGSVAKYTQKLENKTKIII